MSKTPEGHVKDMLRIQYEIICEYFDHNIDDSLYIPMPGRFAQSGEPDARLTLFGLEIHIEAKAENKKPTPTQLVRHTSLRSSGALVFVVAGVGDASNFARYAIPKIRQHIVHKVLLFSETLRMIDGETGIEDLYASRQRRIIARIKAAKPKSWD